MMSSSKNSLILVFRLIILLLTRSNYSFPLLRILLMKYFICLLFFFLSVFECGVYISSVDARFLLKLRLLDGAISFF
ncbi:hypothetical protein BDR07DRAFT_114290 [Suillus spraguei]|nr:hypothetical protein BDR07DRAFT_114290 [Suillus spraguei]